MGTQKLETTNATYAQLTPQGASRGNDLRTQIDKYLSVISRLGIPTSDSDDLNATTTFNEQKKLLFNTTTGKLRIFDPITDTWRDAVVIDLEGYYTKEEIDLLLSNIPSKTTIPNWSDTVTYSKDEPVTILNEDKYIIYKSLEDNNTDSPLEVYPWNHVSTVASVTEWNNETTYDVGDLVLYDAGGLVIIARASVQNVDVDVMVGIDTGIWFVEGILAYPVEYNPVTEYNSFEGIYPTIVSHLGNYFSTSTPLEGIEPKLSTWVQISYISQSLIAYNGLTLSNDVLKLGGIISEQVSLVKVPTPEDNNRQMAMVLNPDIGNIDMQVQNAAGQKRTLHLGENAIGFNIDSGGEDLLNITASSDDVSNSSSSYFSSIINPVTGNHSLVNIANSSNSVSSDVLLTIGTQISGKNRGVQLISSPTSIGSSLLPRAGVLINGDSVDDGIYGIGVSNDFPNLVISYPRRPSSGTIDTTSVGLSLVRDNTLTGFDATEVNRFYRDGRISGKEALNPDEFVTLDQLNNSLEDIVTETEWGEITGDISDQTDLQNALDSKLDTAAHGFGLSYNNATGKMDWGTEYDVGGIIINHANIEPGRIFGIGGSSLLDPVTGSTYPTGITLSPDNFIIENTENGAFLTTVSDGSMRLGNLISNRIVNVDEQAERITLNNAGVSYFTIGNDNANVAGVDWFQAPQFKLPTLNSAPSSSTDSGSVGEIRITSSFIYVCIASNTWVRAELNTW